MPLFYTHPSPIIGIWKIIEPWQDLLELFSDKTMYSNYILALKSDKRKCEWLAIRLLLRHFAGTEKLVDYKENGSPFLKNSPYKISISHTKGYAALVLTENANPGIDIEYRSGRAWKLCSKFLNATELELLHNYPSEPALSAHQSGLSTATLPHPDIPTQQSVLATICWCAKETAYKALQENEVDFIRHFHIAPFIFSNKGSIRLKETKTPKQEVYCINYLIFDEFIMTWKE